MHFIKTRRMVGEIDVFWQNMNHSTKDLIHSAILHQKNDTSFCKNKPTQKPQPYREHSYNKAGVSVLASVILQFCICRMTHHSARITLHRNHSHIESIPIIRLGYLCQLQSFCNCRMKHHFARITLHRNHSHIESTPIIRLSFCVGLIKT